MDIQSNPKVIINKNSLAINSNNFLENHAFDINLKSI